MTEGLIFSYPCALTEIIEDLIYECIIFAEIISFQVCTDLDLLFLLVIIMPVFWCPRPGDRGSATTYAKARLSPAIVRLIEAIPGRILGVIEVATKASKYPVIRVGIAPRSTMWAYEVHSPLLI